MPISDANEMPLPFLPDLPTTLEGASSARRGFLSRISLRPRMAPELLPNPAEGPICFRHRPQGRPDAVLPMTPEEPARPSSDAYRTPRSSFVPTAESFQSPPPAGTLPSTVPTPPTPGRGPRPFPSILVPLREFQAQQRKADRNHHLPPQEQHECTRREDRADDESSDLKEMPAHGAPCEIKIPSLGDSDSSSVSPYDAAPALRRIALKPRQRSDATLMSSVANEEKRGSFCSVASPTLMSSVANEEKRGSFCSVGSQRAAAAFPRRRSSRASFSARCA